MIIFFPTVRFYSIAFKFRSPFIFNKETLIMQTDRNPVNMLQKNSLGSISFIPLKSEKT